ncbi:MAG TPA: DsbA family oxidoreductase [Candidatus Dormibacteraeota bacterium]|nr:DsbA family oxidoreductase [Candidatus Dormibacteraeota bacterium]
MQVEIWSDVVCPRCYIGKRRFESAMVEFDHRDDVVVTWRSFELDPNAPRKREGDSSENLARKYGITREAAAANHDRITRLGAEEGLDYRFDIAVGGNTFDAHRLIHLAAESGLQAVAKERLMAAYFSEGAPIGDPATLLKLAVEVGLEEADVRRVLEGDAYAGAVRADEEEASRLGISGVPFFVLDRRYGLSGAQPAEMIGQALRQAWAESQLEISTPPA